MFNNDTRDKGNMDTNKNSIILYPLGFMTTAKRFVFFFSFPDSDYFLTNFPKA